jgi:hypothetical protein
VLRFTVEGHTNTNIRQNFSDVNVKQNMECTYNVKPRRVPAMIVAVAKQKVLPLWVCVLYCSQLPGMKIASFLRRVIMSSVICLTVPIFPRYLINGTIFGKKF